MLGTAPGEVLLDGLGGLVPSGAEDGDPTGAVGVGVEPGDSGSGMAFLTAIPATITAATTSPTATAGQTFPCSRHVRREPCSRADRS